MTSGDILFVELCRRHRPRRIRPMLLLDTHTLVTKLQLGRHGLRGVLKVLAFTPLISLPESQAWTRHVISDVVCDRQVNGSRSGRHILARRSIRLTILHRIGRLADFVRGSSA
jgi:hypothetical protein